MKRKSSRWLLLSAFGLGLSLDVPNAIRTLFGVGGFLLGTLGFLFASSAASSPAAVDLESFRPDLHETLVAETFDELSPTEAATVVGVLHHYRIASPGHDELCTNALELHAAVDLVSRISGFPKVLLRTLYRDHWIELQGVPAHRICRRLEEHELVHELVAFPEWR